MTKKHFAAIAKELAEVNPDRRNYDYDMDISIARYLQWEACVVAVSKALTALYPEFNKAKFLAACEVSP